MPNKYFRKKLMPEMEVAGQQLRKFMKKRGNRPITMGTARKSYKILTKK
mgnify:FL=1